MGRERDEEGKYTSKISLEEIQTVFEQAEIPVLTATEVAEELDCSRASAYNKLQILTDRGEIYKKKVGARAVVYYQANE